MALVLARAFVAADARALVRVIRYLLGAALVIGGVAMSLAERWGIGLILVSLGVSAMATGRIGPLDLGGGAALVGFDVHGALALLRDETRP